MFTYFRVERLIFYRSLLAWGGWSAVNSIRISIGGCGWRFSSLSSSCSGSSVSRDTWWILRSIVDEWLSSRTTQLRWVNIIRWGSWFTWKRNTTFISEWWCIRSESAAEYKFSCLIGRWITSTEKSLVGRFKSCRFTLTINSWWCHWQGWIFFQISDSRCRWNFRHVTERWARNEWTIRCVAVCTLLLGRVLATFTTCGHPRRWIQSIGSDGTFTSTRAERSATTFTGTSVVLLGIGVSVFTIGVIRDWRGHLRWWRGRRCSCVFVETRVTAFQSSAQFLWEEKAEEGELSERKTQETMR